MKFHIIPASSLLKLPKYLQKVSLKNIVLSRAGFIKSDFDKLIEAATESNGLGKPL